MNYGYKVTKQGRELLAALLATGQDLEITRVAVGSGKATEDTNLADMTDLVEYVAEGKIAQRRHLDNVLYLTVQYASNDTPGLPAFYLAEFAVWAKHQETSEDTLIIYATLGNYIQPVMAYAADLEPDVRQYPMALILSDEINVTISAPPGLVTYEDLEEAVGQAVDEAVRGKDVLSSSDKGVPNGVASLNEKGLIPEAQLPCVCAVVAARSRDPGKPDYGLGGGGEDGGEVSTALNVGEYTGETEAAVVVNGTLYDANNLSSSGDTAPDGTIIIKMEETENA